MTVIVVHQAPVEVLQDIQVMAEPEEERYLVQVLQAEPESAVEVAEVAAAMVLLKLLPAVVV
jgi:hypothetical protein